MENPEPETPETPETPPPASRSVNDSPSNELREMRSILDLLMQRVDQQGRMLEASAKALEALIPDLKETTEAMQGAISDSDEQTAQLGKATVALVRVTQLLQAQSQQR